MLRVFIADDSVAFGTLAAAWLETDAEVVVVGSVRSAAAAVAQVVDAAPDVVLLDRLLPQPEHSAAVLAHVREHLPDAAVILLSGMPPLDLAREAATLGANGSVSKATDARGLLAAVRSAAAGVA